jgi:serine/threonine-protein kinase
MKRFLKWFLVGPALRILLIVVILAGLLLGAPPLATLDNAIFDQLVRLRPEGTNDRVAVVAIDAESIAKVGSWPWPRTYLAEVVSRVSEHQAKAIGFHLLLQGDEWNPALAGLRSLRRKLKLDKKKTLVGSSLVEMEASIDGDSQLIKSLQSPSRIVVPYLFLDGSSQKIKKADYLPPHLNWSDPEQSWQTSFASLHNPFRDWCRTQKAYEIIPSFKSLAGNAPLQGHISFSGDLRRPRTIPLLKQYDGKLFPALVLQLAGIGEDGKNPYLKLEKQALFVNSKSLATGEDFEVFTNPVTEKTVPRFSFFDVINGNHPDDAFKDKVVLLGLTATPVTSGGILSVPEPPPVISSAAVVADLLAGTQIVRPFWAFLLEAAVLVYLGVFLVLVLPRLQPGLGALLQSLFLVSWIGVVAALLILKGMWFQLAPHLIVVIVGLMLLTLQRYLTRGGMKFEDLKMLGLSFQSQGMLDMAFDKFRECPVSDKSVKEILYNLGLDFERKRMFNKAIAVYSHLLKGGKFKDAKKKVTELREMEKSVVLGGNGAKDGTMIIGKGATTPTLGRYEVIRELGQGAMGTVYLGRDPKINREVAIKTLNLHDVEPDQLKEVKARFFREAEAAGRLNHPHIVTIYDAGEEHDLAYMAMEFLDGKDLSAHCSAKKLLPFADVLQIAADVADALAYAHKNDVVHRDIKPSNLMLQKNGKIKVTDFGIARVINSSQTQTGTILGTPSYMSPEQVSGDRVKGASDLFSLGVVCYELFSGQKPFVGDSLGALMHNIANVKYSPLKKVKPGLPESCYTIVRKLLKKEIRDRYRNATEAADALRKCIAKTG